MFTAKTIERKEEALCSVLKLLNEKKRYYVQC